jgi:hypothetical protein
MAAIMAVAALVALRGLKWGLQEAPAVADGAEAGTPGEENVPASESR